MTSNDPVLQKLLQNNVKWAQAVTAGDKDFFPNSAKNPQTPQVLWIGCSDSRVPESVITGSKPGDIFVQRNIANQVHLDDDNVLSVVEYAVAHVKVKHVIVVGHTECGGAKHCVEASEHPPVPPKDPLHRWLEPLTNLARSLKVGSRPNPVLYLVKENVKTQVENLKKLDVVKSSGVGVHGWIYDLSTGLLSTNIDH